MRISDWSSVVCSSDLLIGHAGTGVYNASKLAVEGMSESLAQELEAFGVKVMLVNPDAFKSEFFADRADTPRLDEASVYSGRSEERRVGKECVRQGRYRWWALHIKNKTMTNHIISNN